MSTLQSSIQVKRLGQRFVSDDSRVITRFFTPGSETRMKAIIQRVLDLSSQEVATLLDRVLKDFGPRHRNIEGVLIEHFNNVKHLIAEPDAMTEQRQLLIGSYFTMEYAIESAALFNPSIVPSIDQSGAPQGAVRFVMSLRATGEGHVSSIVFRSGMIDAANNVTFDPISRYSHQLRVIEDRRYDRHTFNLKLIEMGAYSEYVDAILEQLDDRFSLHELNEAIDIVRSEMDCPEAIEETGRNMMWLARSNYVLLVPEGTEPSEIVIFPSTDNESRGIEDARFVRFVDDDGSVFYYGTYTAYNGFHILPQLIETDDMRFIKVHTLNGRYVQNKGMALFPRRVDGDYMMISRLDGENLFLMRSENIHFWNEAEMIQQPTFPWEFVQIGNCGSPLETPAGWLVITHGVGPMRQYCIGATLLDLQDPSKIIGQTHEPLLIPNESERDGYVPNVVYSCGAMIHNDTLFIPYAMSDVATSFATIDLTVLLTHLKGA